MPFPVHEADFPGRDGKGKGKLPQRSVFQVRQNEFPDDAGASQTDAGEINQQIHGGGFQNVFRKEGVFPKINVEILAGQVLPVQEHQDAVLQKRKRARRSGGKRAGAILSGETTEIVQIFLCGHKGVLDLHDGREGQGTQPFRLSGKAQIQLPLLQHLQGVAGGLAGDGDPEMGVQLDEILKGGQKDVFAEGGADPDAQLPHAQLVAQPQLVFRALQGLKGRFYVGIQQFSVLGQLDAPGGAGEKSAAHRLLQLPDSLADGGLADKKLVRGPGDIPGTGDRVKNPVERKILIHGRPPVFLSSAASFAPEAVCQN